MGRKVCFGGGCTGSFALFGGGAAVDGTMSAPAHAKYVLEHVKCVLEHVKCMLGHAKRVLEHTKHIWGAGQTLGLLLVVGGSAWGICPPHSPSALTVTGYRLRAR